MISGHTLCLGISKGGKTTVCKAMAEAYLKAGYKVLLLSTFKNGFPCTEHYNEQPAFIARAKVLENCLLVVDDARDNLDKNCESSKWLGSQSRHWGHSFLIITQRHTDVHPSIRNNAESAILFRMVFEDAKDLNGDFIDKAILTLPELPRYHFLIGGKYQPFISRRLKI